MITEGLQSSCWQPIPGPHLSKLATSTVFPHLSNYVIGSHDRSNPNCKKCYYYGLTFKYKMSLLLKRGETGMPVSAEIWNMIWVEQSNDVLEFYRKKKHIQRVTRVTRSGDEYAIYSLFWKPGSKYWRLWRGKVYKCHFVINLPLYADYCSVALGSSSCYWT